MTPSLPALIERPPTETEYKALEAMAHYYDSDTPCLTFDFIAIDSHIERKRIRRIVRSLARKGLAEYVRGLFNEDGDVAGSGYCCTKRGYEIYRARLSLSPPQHDKAKA